MKLLRKSDFWSKKSQKSERKMKMKTIMNNKKYEREDKSTKRSIDKGVSKLLDRITAYYNQGYSISNIFDDSVLVHDIINKHYYVFKCKVDKLQLRILYTVSKENEVIVVSHYIKKSPTKEYIDIFTNYCD